jgi:hypothetical protein
MDNGTARDPDCINTVIVMKRVILQIRETLSFYMRLLTPSRLGYLVSLTISMFFESFGGRLGHMIWVL